MDFELSDDEVALGEGIRRLCAGRFPLDRLRRTEGQRVVVEPEGWLELAEAGVFSLRLPESSGGLGLGMAAAAVVFEELGRALVPGPLVSSHVAAVVLEPLDQVADGPVGHLIDYRAVAEGKLVVGAICRPGHASTDRSAGLVPVVIGNLESLGALVVVTDDAIHAVDPASLDAEPVQRSLDPLHPLWHLRHLPLGERIAGPESAARFLREFVVLESALLIGMAAATTDMAVEYAQHREQFGRAIGSFQAVKHLCADMLVRAELARAAVHAAAVTLDQPDVGDADRAVWGAAVLAAEAAQANGKSCIQVHGGMGFTWEVPAHLYMMRSRVVSGSLGDLGQLAERVAGRY
ncbi:MAG TPA: acyl-CoA dehydrogenase family protein [Acidimicrobiales bacterium]|nr:acyl-CoA dehydrogenase family protein [Acidimicrobiales bacterium]